MRTQPPEDALAAAATIEVELRKLRSSLARVEEAARQLQPAKAPRRAVEQARPERYFRVLIGVYERGGRHGVDGSALGEIGKEHGYDRRGLGGFFAGARAPLVHVEDRARLTAEGLRLVDDYLREEAP